VERIGAQPALIESRPGVRGVEVQLGDVERTFARLTAARCRRAEHFGAHSQPDLPRTPVTLCSHDGRRRGTNCSTRPQRYFVPWKLDKGGDMKRATAAVLAACACAAMFAGCGDSEFEKPWLFPTRSSGQRPWRALST